MSHISPHRHEGSGEPGIFILLSTENPPNCCACPLDHFITDPVVALFIAHVGLGRNLSTITSVTSLVTSTRTALVRADFIPRHLFIHFHGEAPEHGPIGAAFFLNEEMLTFPFTPEEFAEIEPSSDESK